MKCSQFKRILVGIQQRGKWDVKFPYEIGKANSPQ